MCCAPIVYMLVYILIGAHIVPLKNKSLARVLKLLVLAVDQRLNELR